MLAAIASYEDLVRFIEREGVPHELERESRSVRIPTERKGIRGIQIIRWQDDDHVVQFIQSMLRDIPAERLPALADAVARLNHALAWLGLDLDRARRLLAFRLTVPLLARDSVDPREIQSGFRVAANVGASLTPFVADLVAGDLAPDAIVGAVRSAMEASASTSAYPLPVD
jgi:putative sensory transduction regulator